MNRTTPKNMIFSFLLLTGIAGMTQAALAANRSTMPATTLSKLRASTSSIAKPATHRTQRLCYCMASRLRRTCFAT